MDTLYIYFVTQLVSSDMQEFQLGWNSKLGPSVAISYMYLMYFFHLYEKVRKFKEILILNCTVLTNICQFDANIKCIKLQF